MAAAQHSSPLIAQSAKKIKMEANYQNKAKQKWNSSLILSHHLIFRWGARALWATDRWRGSCCILKSPVSTSSSLILHRSLWHPEQARSDLAACCISILVGQPPPPSPLHSLHQGLYQASNQSQPQAIWCRTSRLSWTSTAKCNPNCP